MGELPGKRCHKAKEPLAPPLLPRNVNALGTRQTLIARVDDRNTTLAPKRYLVAKRREKMTNVRETHALFESLVVDATMAASSHNTQPWRFEIGEDRIFILPDLARRCPVVDPDDHHLYASLGCAAENMVVAAAAKGWEAVVEVRRSGDVHVVEVMLKPGIPVASPLADAIARRQCTRAAFDGRQVSADELTLLERAASGTGVSSLLITDKANLANVADWVAQGNTAQLRDPRWRQELVAWIRFNEREARQSLDGLWSRTSGNPELPRALSQLLLPLVLTPRSQNRKDVPWITSSAGVLVVVSDVDDVAHWVEAGRCYERFALQATALGIRSAFINPPVEVDAIRSQFATWLGVGSKRPDFIVRFGYGPEMPRSLRRPVADVLGTGTLQASSSLKRQLPP